MKAGNKLVKNEKRTLLTVISSVIVSSLLLILGSALLFPAHAASTGLTMTVKAVGTSPYRAGSTVALTVTLRNNSNKEVDISKFTLTPSVSRSDVLAYDLESVRIPDKTKVPQYGTYQQTFQAVLSEDAPSAEDVVFSAVLKNTKNVQDTSANTTFSVEALEGISITSAEDLGSVFNGDLYVSFRYKNYDFSEKTYTWQLAVNGETLNSNQIKWIDEPQRTLVAKESETIRMKIPVNGLKATSDSYDVTLKITDENLSEDEYTLHIEKTSLNDVIGTLPDGVTSLDQLYYGSVANDAEAPFHSAAELKSLLTNSSAAYAKSIWSQYQYDLYDPNFSKRGGCGALEITEGSLTKPDYSDKLLASTGHTYPKDGESPFHINPTGKIVAVKGMDLRDGNLVAPDDGNSFRDLKKNAGPDDGDENTEREYTVNLEAKAKLKMVKPVLMVFQIQTSWQMFDLLHANDRASLVNGQAVTADLLSLYEMKKGFLDFIKWAESEGEGNVMISITNFQHGGTHSMIPSPYFTNMYSEILTGLYGWDSFGDCEHIHYSKKELVNACNALGDASNFTNWTDAEGHQIYNEANAVSIIIGGGCESADLKDHQYLLKIPGTQYPKIKAQFGIRTNAPTGNGVTNDMISWMDYENQSGKFNGGYYKSIVTRQEFFDTLKDIYEKSTETGNARNVVIEDTITREFQVERDSVRAYVDGKELSDSDVTFQFVSNDDGTTTVRCIYDKVPNGKKVKLSIPVKSQEDYLGSNNVKTNSGTPTLTYQGIYDSSKNYTQKFKDTPMVNVPIHYPVSDGDDTTVSAGSKVDLSTLAQNNITKGFEEWLKKYDQMEGTVTYQWIDDNGNPVGNPAASSVTEQNRKPPSVPSAEVATDTGQVGETLKYHLKITFTPADVKNNSANKKAVSELSKSGLVEIHVTEPHPAYTLPNAGGPGTYPAMLLGGMLTGIAFFAGRRKMSEA